MKKIVLIAGHNRAGLFPPHRRDPGAICPFENTNEHYEAEKIVYQAAEILRRGAAAGEVFVCDFKLDLAGKTKMLNRDFPGETVVIEVHFNSYSSPEATGVETWYVSGDKQAEENAMIAQKILAETLGIRDRGIRGDLRNRWGRLGILRDTKTRGRELLVEIGFISNPDDLRRAREAGPRAIARAALALSQR